MKKIVFILFFINSLVFSQDNILPFNLLEGVWILDKSFSDEFDKSKLDEKKWWDFNPAWHGRKPSHFARSNVKVKKGLLRNSRISFEYLFPTYMSYEGLQIGNFNGFILNLQYSPGGHKNH